MLRIMEITILIYTVNKLNSKDSSSNKVKNNRASSNNRHSCNLKIDR